MAKNPFKSAKVMVQNRSPFDLSHNNYCTVKVGTLTPVMVERVMPNDTISLGLNFRAQLPPLASNFLGHVNIRYNAFFVPNRLLVGHFKEYIENCPGVNQSPDSRSPLYMPYLKLTAADNPNIAAGSLADYLGFKTGGIEASKEFEIDALPFLAYHRIYSDWYRQPSVQRSPYMSDFTSGMTEPDVTNLHRFVGGSYEQYDMNDPSRRSFVDNVNILDLRQVNYPKDYFTNALTSAQDSVVMKVGLAFPETLTMINKTEYEGESTGGDLVALDNSYVRLDNGETNVKFDFELRGSNNEIIKTTFSIPQLRSANSLQKFAENNALAGGRYKDVINANYGVTPSDALCEMPIYLGGFSQEIYKNQVNVTSDNPNGEGSVSNPFSAYVGGSAAAGFCLGQDTLIDNYTVTEHGFIMVLADVIPSCVYGTGIRRYLLHGNSKYFGTQFVDRFCVPALAGVGNQPIFKAELSGYDSSVPYGYAERYAEYKWHDDEVHGLIRNGEDLSFFAVQRNFQGSNIEMSSQAITVPQTALDNITSVANDLSRYGVILDNGFSMKAIRPLPTYSIPTLCEDVDKHLETIERGGRRL